MPNTAEIRDTWNQMAPNYATWAATSTTLLSRSLLAMLRVSESTSFLETGAGIGLTAEITAGMLPPGARHTITDLSPVMVEMAQARNPGLEVVEADSEALPFADASFDRYLANMNLMIVADPDRALAEAFRVLRPGGLAAWSVWGRPNHSPLMTLPQRAEDKSGIRFPRPERSNFHLGRRRKLQRHLENAGFEDIVYWRQPMVMQFNSGAEFTEKLFRQAPRMVMALAELGEKAKARYARTLTRMAQKELDAGHPLALEILVMVARKPEESLVETDTEERLVTETVLDVPESEEENPIELPIDAMVAPQE